MSEHDETSHHTGVLTLGDILTTTGAPAADSIVAIRHAYQPDNPTGLRTPADVTPERVREYTCGQKQPLFDRSTLWLVFIADGSTRSRFYTAYENRGVLGEESEGYLRFDLAESDYLMALQNRLIVDWSNPVAWFMGGVAASRLPVTEISDPQVEPFPGFDHFVLDYARLQAVVSDPRYLDWRSALSSVQAVYLITDTSTGKQYVGQAAGDENLLGRWADYAATGHGGNVELRRLLEADPQYAQHFIYSVLRVFGPTTLAPEVYAAENHFMSALGTRKFGLNH